MIEKEQTRDGHVIVTVEADDGTTRSATVVNAEVDDVNAEKIADLHSLFDE